MLPSQGEHIIFNHEDEEETVAPATPLKLKQSVSKINALTTHLQRASVARDRRERLESHLQAMVSSRIDNIVNFSLHNI